MDPKLDVDEIWRSLGKWGRYQSFQLAISLLGIVPCAFQLFAVVFIGYRPKYECAEVENITRYAVSTNKNIYIQYDACSIDIYQNTTNGSSLISTQDCPEGYTYSLEKDRTFVTEWDLVCKGAERAEFSQTLLMIGQAFGSTIASTLSDRFGRKMVHTISHIGILGIGIGVSFAPNYTTLTILRILMGVCQQGVAMSGVAIALEVLPQECRFLSEVLGLLVWTTGVMLITPFGYFLQNVSWRYIQLALTLYSSYSLIQYWIQDESLRWLLINGKEKEAERILRKAARWNNVKFDDVMNSVRLKTSEKAKLDLSLNVSIENGSTIPSSEKQNEVKQQSTGNGNTELLEMISNRPTDVDKVDTEEFKVEQYTILTLLKERRVLIISLIMWFTWITNSVTYMGLTLTSTSLAGNRFLNYFLSAVAEYPAVLIEYSTLNRYGRKFTCIMFHLIVGVSLAAATVLNYYGGDNSTMAAFTTVFTLIGKMGITGSFSTIFLYTPELYPTNMRTAGIGFASAAARIGGMLSPFSITLAGMIPWAPGTVFSVMCLIVSFLLLYLPETSGYELPQTMSELKTWYKYNSGTKNALKSRKKRAGI